MSRPTFWMLAGPNGAGKSSLYAHVIQPSVDAPFINADVIQREELKDASMRAAYKAAEIAENRRRQALRRGRSFVSESTFSHPSKLEFIHEARAAGFRVAIFHVNVSSPELSIRRVAARVEEGGHDVPEDKVRERYERNQALIRAAVLQADRAFVYDNSALNQVPWRVMDFNLGRVVRIDMQMPRWARILYAEELGTFSRAHPPRIR